MHLKSENLQQASLHNLGTWPSERAVMVCRSNLLPFQGSTFSFPWRRNGVEWVSAGLGVRSPATIPRQDLDPFPSHNSVSWELFLRKSWLLVARKVLSGGGLAVYLGYLPTYLSVFSMSVETCQQCCWISTGDDAASSRAGVSALSSILLSKLLVPPPGSFPKGWGRW